MKQKVWLFQAINLMVLLNVKTAHERVKSCTCIVSFELLVFGCCHFRHDPPAHQVKSSPQNRLAVKHGTAMSFGGQIPFLCKTVIIKLSRRAAKYLENIFNRMFVFLCSHQKREHAFYRVVFYNRQKVFDFLFFTIAFCNFFSTSLLR